MLTQRFQLLFHRKGNGNGDAPTGFYCEGATGKAWNIPMHLSQTFYVKCSHPCSNLVGFLSLYMYLQLMSECNKHMATPPHHIPSLHANLIEWPKSLFLPSSLDNLLSFFSFLSLLPSLATFTLSCHYWFFLPLYFCLSPPFLPHLCSSFSLISCCCLIYPHSILVCVPFSILPFLSTFI